MAEKDENGEMRQTLKGQPCENLKDVMENRFNKFIRTSLIFFKIQKYHRNRHTAEVGAVENQKYASLYPPYVKNEKKIMYVGNPKTFYLYTP